LFSSLTPRASDNLALCSNRHRQLFSFSLYLALCNIRSTESREAGKENLHFDEERYRLPCLSAFRTCAYAFAFLLNWWVTKVLAATLSVSPQPTSLLGSTPPGASLPQSPSTPSPAGAPHLKPASGVRHKRSHSYDASSQSKIIPFSSTSLSLFLSVWKLLLSSDLFLFLTGKQARSL
jgi:hypothetical protein